MGRHEQPQHPGSSRRTAPIPQRTTHPITRKNHTNPTRTAVPRQPQSVPRPFCPDVHTGHGEPQQHEHGATMNKRKKKKKKKRTKKMKNPHKKKKKKKKKS